MSSPRAAEEGGRPAAWALRLGELPWFLAAVGLPLVWTARNVRRDLWYDEVYTLFLFASRPVADIVRDYSAPNNHVAFTLLVKPVLLVSTSEWAVRAPSLLCAVAALIFVYFAALRWLGRDAATLSAAALALCQMFQNFAVEVRGYALSMALVAGLLAAATMAPGWRRLATIALLATAAIYTIPTNALIVAALAVGVGCAPPAEPATAAPSSRLRGWLAAAAPWVLGFALAALLYVPLADGLQAARAAMEQPPAALGLDRMTTFAAAALADEWPLALLALAGWGFWTAKAWKARGAWLIVIALCGAMPFLAAGLLRLPLYTRLFSPLLPPLAIAVGAGLALLGRRALPARWIAPVGLVLLYVIAGPRLWTYDARLAQAVAADPRVQDGYFNFYASNFRPGDVARWIDADRPRDGAYAIVFAPVDHYHLQYYLFEQRLPENNVVPRGPGKYRGTLYLVGPEPLDYEAIARHYEFNPAELRRFPRVAREGYFSIYRSPPDFELTVRP